MPRQSNSEEVVMAGDGGRVPDVSEQRRPYTHVCMDCGALGFAGGYHDHGGGNAGESIALTQLPDVIRSLQQFEQRAYEAEEELTSDPASVLAVLLAESPEATVAAIEALLTNGEAVEAMMRELATYRQECAEAGYPPGAVIIESFPVAMDRAGRAYVRSLLSKAPKEDGDA